jgi:hypothetical protein
VGGCGDEVSAWFGGAARDRHLGNSKCDLSGLVIWLWWRKKIGRTSAAKAACLDERLRHG